MVQTEDGRLVFDDICEDGRIAIDAILEDGHIITVRTISKESSIGLVIQETKTKTSSIGVDVQETKTKTSSIGLNVSGTVTKESSIGVAIQETKTKTSSIGVDVQETKTKTSSIGVDVQETKTKTSSIGLNVLGTVTKESSIGLSIQVEEGLTSSIGMRVIERKTKTSSIGVTISGEATKTSSIGLAITEEKTKASSIGLAIVDVMTKASSIGMQLVDQNIKESSIGLTVKGFPTKESSIGLNVVTPRSKESSIGMNISGSNTLVSSIGLTVYEPVLSKGFYYAKLGDTILIGVTPENFRITKEINMIPTFEFEISNCTENRAAISAGINDTFKIYWLHHGVNTHFFTGIINADGIEYISLDSIQITGFASYVKLAWPFHKHLALEDAEPVEAVLDFNGAYTDYTAQANSPAQNDVILTFNNVNHSLYIGSAHPFWGAQIIYSTPGICSGSCDLVLEYSKTGDTWKTLDVLDESNGFTGHAGAYDLIISHPPSDWNRTVINGIKKYWIRFRIANGGYSTAPKLNRIYIVNVDVYRTYYFDTSAREILLCVLADTGYTMDAIDACPVDIISIVAEYESPLRIIAAIANALTWTDSNSDKKSYQWWIDDNKKVHIKQKRGTTYNDDITGDLTIFNNHEDYFHLSNRIIGLGPRDGLSQIRAIVEDRASIAQHGLREIAVPKEQVGKYLMLRNALEKDIAISRNPMQRIKGDVTTEFWGLREYEVGDRITLHQTAWNVPETTIQIVKAEIGPLHTALNLGISQEHLEGLKDDLQRQLNLNNVIMHGSTTVLSAGPETMNYQRVSDTEVYPAKLEIEIPSDVVKVHKVLLSWSIVPYRADVGPNSVEIPAHDHDGWGGAGGAIAAANVGAGGEFTPDVTDGGGFTPLMLGEAHKHQVNETISIVPDHIVNFTVPYASQGPPHTIDVQGLEHRHSGGGTGFPNSTAGALIDVAWDEWCEACGSWLISSYDWDVFALGDHYHQNSDTGYTTPPGYIELMDLTIPSDYEAFILDVPSDVESVDGHIHDGVEELDHGHTGIPEAAHSDHVVAAESAHADHSIVGVAGASVETIYSIYEEAAGTTLELLVNDEKVGEYSTAQTEIRIDGFMNTGNNTAALQPIVGENKKGGADIKANGVLFVEPVKF